MHHPVKSNPRTQGGIDQRMQPSYALRRRMRVRLFGWPVAVLAVASGLVLSQTPGMPRAAAQSGVQDTKSGSVEFEVASVKLTDPSTRSEEHTSELQSPM